MLDLRLLRENPDVVREALQRRRIQFDLDQLLHIDKQRRAFLTQIEEQRHRLKQESEAFARSKAKGGAPPGRLKKISDDNTTPPTSL